MMENITTLSTTLLLGLLKELEIDPANVKPELMPWLESKLIEAATTIQADTQAKLDVANATIETLRAQNEQETAYEPYARELTYAMGFNDGMAVARDGIVGKLRENHPKAAEKVLEELGDKEVSPAYAPVQDASEEG